MKNEKLQRLIKQRRRAKQLPAKKLCVAATATAAFALSLTVTFSSMAATVYDVGVAGEEESTQVLTFKNDPNKVIDEAGINVDSHYIFDVESISGGSNSEITVYKSGSVELSIDGNTSVVETRGTTVEQMLNENGIVLGEYDEISCSPDDNTYDGMSVEITRAFDVPVTADDATEIYTTAGGKVGQALAFAGIELGAEDELDGCSLDDELYDGMEINVLRCKYDQRTALEEYEYPTLEEIDDSLYVGQTKILQQGENGTVERVYNEKYLGKSVVTSEVISQSIVEPAVAKIIAVGTKRLDVSSKGAISTMTLPNSLNLDSNGLPKDYAYSIDGVATAYSGGGITATGKDAIVGRVAVDPRVIPYGTELYIVSLDGRYVYGYCVAEDTGGFVDGGWADVDLYMNTESECRNFGIRGVRIYVLD